MQIVVNSLLTTYQRTGIGKLVLVLHGWADSSASWRTFAAALGKDYEVITIDLPGFGGSETPRTDWDLSAYAGFVADFIRKLNLRPYVIVGHSNGGAIAIRGLTHGDLHAEKLVLLASAGVRGEQTGRNRLFQTAAKVGKVFTAPLPSQAKQKLRHQLYKTAGSDMLVAEHMQGTFKKIVAEDIRTDASKLHLPTLLVYGDADTETPVRYGQMLHGALTTSQLKVIAGAGHFLQLDEPQGVTALVKDFLNG